MEYQLWSTPKQQLKEKRQLSYLEIVMAIKQLLSHLCDYTCSCWVWPHHRNCTNLFSVKSLSQELPNNKALCEASLLRSTTVNENLPVIRTSKQYRKRAQTAVIPATGFQHLNTVTLPELDVLPWAPKQGPLLLDNKINSSRRQHGYRYPV